MKLRYTVIVVLGAVFCSCASDSTPSPIVQAKEKVGVERFEAEMSRCRAEQIREDPTLIANRVSLDNLCERIVADDVLARN